MPDATVNIGGDASGAIAAVAAAQGAIDSLHGKTVNVEVNVRQNGGGAGGLASDLGRAGNAAERVGQRARGMGDSFDRAGRSARGMSDHVGHVGDHMGRAADQAERMRTHMDAVNNIMGGGAPGAVTQAQGMRRMAIDAQTASRAIGSIGSNAQQAQRAIGGGDGGGFKAMGASAHGVSVEVMGIYRNARQAITAAGEAGSAFSTASGHTNQMGSDLARAGEAGKDLARLGESGKDIAKIGDAVKGIGGGNGLSGMDLAMKGLRDVGGDLGSSLGKAGSVLDSIPTPALAASTAIKGIGLAGGVSAIGMGALGAAVAGVGLAGVAEDFAHNSQLMNAGSEAVRGFNKQFSAMRSESSAAGMPQMDAFKGSLAGVGHELAGIGAKNIAPVLQDATALGNSATSAMRQLEPAIGPATQALTALGGAVIGAFGNSGPAVTSFADTITQNSAGIQSTTEGIVNTMSSLGSAVVSTYANLPQGMANVGSGNPAQAIGDLGRSKLGGLSLLSAHPAGTSFGPADGPPNTPGGPAAPPSTDIGWHPAQSHGVGNFDSQGAFGLPKLPPGGGGASPDANRFSGMAAGDILTQQRADVGLPPVGAPHYSGVGPRGPGQSVGPMPASAAAGLGGGGIQPFNNMMQAAQNQVAGGGASTGTAMVQHIQKAVQVAAPAATAGGASMGAAMNSGMAQGQNSTQSVVDTVTIKHSKHIIDIASAALGIHSPSTEMDYLGRMTWRGFGQGQEREAAGTFGSMSNAMGRVLSGAQDQAQRFAPDYDGSSGATVTVKRSNDQAMQYGPAAMARIKSHNDRAGQLATGREDLQRQAIGGMTHDERRDQIMQNRANNHERALANLHISGHAKPSGDVNPFAGDQHQSLWNTVTRQGPIGDLRAQFSKAGQNSVQGLSQSMTAHIPKVQAAGAAIAGAGHAGYKKKDRQASPSAEWAAMAGNSVAGAVGAMNAGGPALAAAGASMAGSMQAAAIGPMSDAGLMVGYAYATNVTTGVATQIKKADYQSQGLPSGIGQAGMMGLAKTRLLNAGSGAQSYKTPGNAPGLVVLPAATPPPPQVITINHNFDISGQMYRVATEVSMDHMGRVTDAISRAASM